MRRVAAICGGVGRVGRGFRRLVPAAALCSAAALVWVGEASAAQTITVCASGCDYTSIQPAIDNASDGATIQISAGSYSGFAVPDTNTNLTSLTLQGAGAGQTIISGGGPVIMISSGAVAISGVTVSGAKTPASQVGGGIENQGTLTLSNSTVSGNAGGQSGGGIDNNGGLTLTDSTVSGNHAATGGGINSQNGPLTLTNSTVSGNTAGQWGGGINFSSGTLVLSGSTVSGNTAYYHGGGIYTAAATARLSNSTVSGNTLRYRESTGGGIYVAPPSQTTLSLSSSKISDNHARDGAGIAGTAQMTLTHSTVSGNTATGEGGGFYFAGKLMLIYSTVSGNSAASTGPVRGGGGIFQKGGTVTLQHSTVSGNKPDNCERSNSRGVGVPTAC